MKSWTPLWSMVVGSSIWDEPDWVVKVFLTMLALKDSDHIVRRNAYQLGKDARKSEQEILDALKILSSPDTKRIEPQPFDGRRIQAVEEGWLILNGEKYRTMLSVEMKRARNRRAQEAHRQRKKLAGEYPPKSKPLPGEARYVRKLEQDGVEAADAMVDMQVPL